MITAPAFLKRWTTVESRVAAGVPTSTFEPPSVTTPASSNRSLIEIGMPARSGQLRTAASLRVHAVCGSQRFLLMDQDERARAFPCRILDCRQRLLHELAARDFLIGKTARKLDDTHGCQCNAAVIAAAMRGQTVHHRVLVALAICFGLSSITSAHHSFSEFDQRKTIEISGTLSDVAWQNPHVRLKVQSVEAGRVVTWDIECHSVGVLSRTSIDAKALKVGDKVKVAGNPSKASPVRMFATNVLTSAGQELVMQPRTQPRWNADAKVPGPAVAANPQAVPPVVGIFHVWSSSFEDPTTGPFALWSGNMSLTASAKKALAAWDPVHDTIAKGCDPKGMPTIMEQPYGMAFEDHGKTILLRLEEYDSVRTIHMSDGVPAPATKSLLGHSVGRWEGADLVVTTTGVSWKYIAPNGLPQGPSSRMVERFTLAQDGKRLEYTVTITDPDTFTTPAVLKRAWVFRPTERVQKYSCGTRRAVGQ